MGPLLIAAGLTAGAGLLGQYLTNQSNARSIHESNKTNREMASNVNALNYKMMQENNVFNEAQSARQMDFQRDMSNTAYQRAVVDMKAAGINPMLAVSNGGASSPGGSAIPGALIGAQLGAPNAPVPGAFSGVIHSGLKAYKLHQDMQNLRATNREISSKADLNEQLTRVAQTNMLSNVSSAQESQERAATIRAMRVGQGAKSKFHGSKYGLYNNMLRYFSNTKASKHSSFGHDFGQSVLDYSDI